MGCSLSQGVAEAWREETSSQGPEERGALEGQEVGLFLGSKWSENRPGFERLGTDSCGACLPPWMPNPRASAFHCVPTVLDGTGQEARENPCSSHQRSPRPQDIDGRCRAEQPGA